MRKLCLFALPFCAAILAACLELPAGILLPVGLAAALLGILAGCTRRLPVCLLCLGLAAGLLWFYGWTQLFRAPAQDMDGQTAAFSATVTDWPAETSTGRIQVEARLHLENARGPKVLLYLEPGLTLVPGDTLTGTARFQNAATDYSLARGIFLQGSVTSAAAEHPRRVSAVHWPVYIARSLKQSIHAVFPQDVSGLLQALLTGDSSALSDGDYAALRRSGAAHIAAVSGLHLSFFAGFLSLFFRRRSRIGAVLTILLMVLFAAVAGFTPSVCRAAFMNSMTLLAPLLGRENDSPTTLCAAMLALLAVNPFCLLSASFQLSFASVAGIYLFARPLYQAVTRSLPGGGSRLRRLLLGEVRLALSNLSVTLGALVLTTPLCAYHFGTFSLIAPVTNLLILWAVSLLFAPALLLTVTGIFLPAWAAAAAIPVTLLLRHVLAVVRRLGSLTFASVSTGGAYLCAWLTLAYVLLIWTLLRRDRRPVLPACAMVFTLCAALMLTGLSSSSSSLTITMLDVGQGQCILLRSGERSALIDCGGDSAGELATDRLQSMGLNRLDLLILTHCHSDHANGVPALLSRIEVTAMIYPVLTQGSPSSTQETLTALARDAGTELYPLERDLSLSFGESTLTLYAPLGSGDTNEEGLFALASCGDFDLLVTGDADSLVESLLVKYADLPDIEVLAAGHHGSAHSVSDLLLDAVTPETVLISVGADNTYGHPADETLARLAARGIDIYRTDLMGSLTVRYEGA